MGTRTLGRLSALKVQRLKTKGRYNDGGGLYLQVSREGTKSWIYRFQMQGRVRDMGLGSLWAISLADARDFAAQCRTWVAKGIDPIEVRKRAQQEKALEAARAVTFATCAESLIEAKRPSWRNAKHAAQWSSTLQAYAYPVMGHLPVGDVDTNLVLKAIQPIWNSKPATAGRLRQRIEAVLDAAKARGLRTGENPARWRGHLENLLPRTAKLRRVRHHPALPYTEVGAFMAQLRKQEGMAALALQLVVLTATRTSEALRARWSEIDLDRGVWTIPAERIKAGKEHRIPLAASVLALLAPLHQHRSSEFVFPGRKCGEPLSNMALLELLKRMKRADITTHGFRSTFRDWAAEQTAFPREVAEMALAHAIENKVEAAYRRGGLFEKRAKLMAAWANYCATLGPAAQVLPLRANG